MSLWVLYYVEWLVSWLGIFSPPAQLNLVLEHVVDERALYLDTAVYYNALHQPFSISKCKYYIGNPVLLAAAGPDFHTNTYFLADVEVVPTLTFPLEKIPPGKYQALQFTLGVDSLHNCSGVQSGALDPENAMFWAWNTGYIFLKLEGMAPASKSPGHFFEYHIGGYKAPNNCIRTITLPFQQALELAPGDQAELRLKVNIAEILRTPNTIDFATHSAITDFHHAHLIADNYVDMFSIR
jgi:hypothetical protein